MTDRTGEDDDGRKGTDRRRDERRPEPDEATLAGLAPGNRADDEETLPGGPGHDDLDTVAQIPASSVSATEQPTGDVDFGREGETVHDAAAATHSGAGSPAQDDEATIAGPLPTGGHTSEDDLATTAPPDAAGGDDRTLGEDEATLAGPGPTERRTRGVVTRRGEGTRAGDFAGTNVGGREHTLDDDDDEEATVFEPGLAEQLGRETGATRADPAAGTPRRGNATAPSGTLGASATARDPAAAGYTDRGGHSGERAGPIRLEEGEPLGRYMLVKRLGKGGMGEVWKARHTLLQGDRAIKVIKASISRDPVFRARFLNEGQTMMRVKHGGVVEVTDLDQTRINGELFMVMEHLEGRTLYDAIRDNDAPLRDDPRNVARIYRELALGMQRIHEERIVHKDLKSDNALLVRGDDGAEHPKVIDFGLAKSLDDTDKPPADAAAEVDGTYEPDLRTTLSGTLAYMAPEQFLGEPSSFQTDIYAFGVMFYECFMKGEYPMARGGVAHYIQMHADGVRPKLLRAARPDLDRHLADLSDRCMAPRRADRPESFRQVADELWEWLDAPERARRRKRLIGMAAAASFLIAVAVWGFFFAGSKAAVIEPQVAAPGRALERVDHAFHLRAEALPSVEVSATLDGDAKAPYLTIDGERAATEPRVEGGRLLADVDLSELPDGRHELALYATAGGKTAPLAIVVDRRAPTIRSLDVPGARDGFSAAVAPEVRIALDEATIAKVVARVDGVADVVPGNPASEDGPRDAWVIAGTAKQPGRVAMDVEVQDHAGNVTTQRFAYTWDTAAPEPSVGDLVDADHVLPVRTGVGARLAVAMSEAGRAALRIGSHPATERTVAAAGALAFDLPAIPPDGLAANLVVEDLAGNSWQRDFRIEVRPDVTGLVTVEDRRPRRIVSTDPEIKLLLTRSYALVAGGISAVRTRDASGARVQEAPTAISSGAGAAISPFEQKITISRSDLAEGTWLLTPTGQVQADARPFELVIDSTRPTITALVVRDEDGDEISDGGWSHSRRVFIDVTAADVTLRQIAVEGAGTFDGPFDVGTNTHRFELVCPQDGLTKSSISLTDAAGNTAPPQSLNIRADSTDPALDVRAAGSVFNDEKGVDLVGRVEGEIRYKVHVLAPAGSTSRGVPISADFTQPDFRVNVPGVPAGHQTLQVWATDDSGRRSVTRTVTVDVEHLVAELPKAFDWDGPVSSRMLKVEPGDVVVGGRVFPVIRTYLDRTEVTNAQYRAFLAATGGRRDDRYAHPDTPADWSHVPPTQTWGDPQWSADDLPVVNVAYWDAYAFAKWSGRRLPTEAEWVKAAVKREGEPDLLRWPFGNEWKDGLLVTAELLVGAAVQAPRSALEGRDTSDIGCLHMGGNVSEWVDLEREPAGNPTTAVRGGNWYLSAAAANVRDVPAKRYDRSERHATIGFRCAVGEDVVRQRLGSPSR